MKSLKFLTEIKKLKTYQLLHDHFQFGQNVLEDECMHGTLKKELKIISQKSRRILDFQGILGALQGQMMEVI